MAVLLAGRSMGHAQRSELRLAQHRVQWLPDFSATNPADRTHKLHETIIIHIMRRVWAGARTMCSGRANTANLSRSVQRHGSITVLMRAGEFSRDPGLNKHIHCHVHEGELSMSTHRRCEHLCTVVTQASSQHPLRQVNPCIRSPAEVRSDWTSQLNC